jgi:hypothetical protein
LEKYGRTGDSATSRDIGAARMPIAEAASAEASK